MFHLPSITDDEEAVLNELLEDSAINRLNDFIVSTAFECRRSVDDRDKFRFSITNHEILPKWIEPAYPLGPYERVMLNRFMNIPNNVVIFRSGTGSGKSSLLNYLSLFCGLDYNKEKFFDKEELPIRNFFVVIDLQGLDDRYTDSIDRVKNREEFFRCVDGITTILADRLEAGFFACLDGTEYDKKSHIGKLVRQISSQSATTLITGAQWGRAILANIDDLDSGSDFDIGMQAIAILRALKHPEHRLYAWLLLWCQLSYATKKTDALRDIGIILAIDNVDQMAFYLQNIVWKRLTAFFQDHYTAKSNIKVLFMMRLSSASDKVATLPHAKILKAHEPPSVMDILSIRLALFLSEPARYGSYSRLQGQDAANIYSRVYSFYQNILDPYGDMRRLLVGMSGTNLRLAIKQSIKWISNNKEGLIPAEPEVVEKISSDIAKTLIPFEISRVVSSIGRGTLLVLGIEQREEHFRSPEAFFPTMFIDEVAFQIASVFRHSRLLRLKGVSLRGKRCEVGELIGTEIEEAIRNRENERQPPSEDEIVIFFSECLQRAKFFSEPNQNEVKLVVEFAEKHLLNKVKAEIERSGREVASIVEHVCKLFVRALGKATGDRSSDGEVAQEWRSCDYFFGQEIQKSVRVGSRYRAAITMLGEDVRAGTRDYSPLNVFRSPYPGSTFLPLYVLYRIAEKKDNHAQQNTISYGDILRDIRNFGFEETDLQEVFKQMVRRDRKLIFSAVHDEVNTIASWQQDREKSIHLTWAGKMYLDQVVTCPPYLQWAFSNIDELYAKYWTKEMKEDNIANRIRFALAGFREMITKEIGKIERLKGIIEKNLGEDVELRMLNHQSFRCKAPIVDVFIRSMWDFQRACLNAAKGVYSKGRNRVEDLRVARELYQITEEWGDQAGKYVSVIGDVYGEVPVHWEENIEWCRNERDSFKGEYERFL